ncbi:MAG: HlyD family efflux transporter periplasmic adaptor subunit, partial [Planctomycetota bacterium]
MSRILIGLVVAAALVGGFAVVFPKWAHQLTGMTHTTMRPPTAELIDNAGASADDQTLAILQPPVDAVGGETPPDAFPSDSAQPTFTNASMNATSPTMLAQSNDLRVQGSVPAPRLYGRTSTDDGFGEVPSGAIRAGDCRVVLIEETRVPAEADGVIKEMLVEEGQIVKKGDTIAKLGTERAQRQLDLATANENVAKMDAKNDVNVRDAKNTARISEFEEKGYREMLRDGAAPLFDVNQKILEAKRGRLRVEVAEMDQEKAQLELVAKGAERAIAEDEIKRRTIVAPFDGYVERRYSKLGEWVQPGSPIIHLVQLNQ